MKVRFLFGIAAFSGTVCHGTFYPTLHQTASYMRRWALPSPNAFSLYFGQVSSNISDLYAACNPDFLVDLDTYANLYQTYHNIDDPFAGYQNRYSMFTYICWNLFEYLGSQIDPLNCSLSDLDAQSSGLSSIYLISNANVILSFPGSNSLLSKFI